jgi:hypothetical protein
MQSINGKVSTFLPDTLSRSNGFAPDRGEKMRSSSVNLDGAAAIVTHGTTTRVVVTKREQF